MWTILSFEYVLKCYSNLLYYNCILEWALATNFPLILSEYCFEEWLTAFTIRAYYTQSKDVAL